VVKVKHTKLESGEIKSEIDAPEEVKILRANL
jgi:sRNA-binding carbon storage regulator CsrA